ncbi:energy-coupling factor transporter transmembrane component T family protein [Enteractinococcus coprophilus]|uniref:Energy-coupling factor transport system permease protein n=1 Tax=Enteractinococcus coprophilus TaxID=1027633 RepID=A0A543AGJ1_9MICC|nr:energy-coupling factor transporter transmembrane component T [Enteractinococcus coprophilus]TQL71698.1 energy-coupling factor transport system permease protein [Enteractinococcus coprophilus]
MTTLTLQHPSTLVEPGAITRWNPSVKLITLFVVSVSMLFIWEPIRPALLWAALVIIALTIGNVPARWLAFAHIPFIAFGFGLFLVNVLARAEDGVVIGAALAGRTLVIGVASILFLTSTAPVDLMRSLNQNLKLPASITFAVLAGYQLLLGLPKEWQTIRAAQVMRHGGAKLNRKGKPKLTIKDAGRLVFTVLIVALRRSERIATSLESRGFGLKPRTVYRPIRVHAGDVVVGLVVCLFAVAYCLPWI